MSVARVALVLALGYLLPAKGILKRVAEKREDQQLRTFEVKATFTASGPAAQQLSQASGLPLTSPANADPALAAPALLTVKAPGRCKLELLPAGVAGADRPSVTSKYGQLSGTRGLDALPAAAGLVNGVCAVLAERGVGADPDVAYAKSLARVGVPVEPVALGRFDGKLAYVLGAQPWDATRPQAWVDKSTFEPARVILKSGAALVDVRLLDFGSPVANDWFPRAVEAAVDGQVQVKLETERVVANPKVPDAIF